MYEIRKTIDFDAGHRLMNHNGKCRNLHGHRYRVTIFLQSQELDSNSMVVDFSTITDICKKWIDQWWDHGLILNFEDAGILDLCKENGWRVYVLNEDPTAEVMARFLLNTFNTLLAGDRISIQISKVEVQETPTSVAAYYDV